MTSVLNVDEIAAKDGTSPVTLTKQSAAKSWNYINGSFSVLDSFNVSSCTDEGGSAPNTWTINMTNAMANATYMVAGNAETSGQSPRNIGISSPTSSSYFVSCIVSNAPANSTSVTGNTSVHGDLA